MKNMADSIKAKLIRIAAEENITYQNIQTKFLLERMVARITKDKFLFNKLIFKGGYVGLRIFHSPRYTIDLDALIKSADVEKVSEAAIEALEFDNKDGTWFKYEKKQNLLTLGEYGGVRLYFRSGLGEPLRDIKKAQMIHLDLGIGDAVVPAPVQNSMFSMIGDSSILWKVYTIESATAEKLHTLIIRGSDNSRSKDVFDLFFFLPQCKKSVLREAISATFKARGDEVPPDIAAAITKVDKELLKKGWKNAIAGLTEEVDFDVAFKKIIVLCKEML